jgi:CPA1 family monovalent cation:H+ antiporter
LVQGLTLPYLIRRTGLFEIVATEDPEDVVLKRIRKELREQALAFLKEKVKHEHPKHAGLGHLIAHWENKANTNFDPKNAHTRELVLEMLEIQRQHLMVINRDPAIDEEIIRQELYLIDLEEERLRMKL